MLPSIGTTITEESIGLVVIINSDYSVSYVSPRLSELSGIEKESANVRFCYQLLRQREQPCEDPCPLRQVLQSGELCSSSQDYLRESAKVQSFGVEWVLFQVRHENRVYPVIRYKTANPGTNSVKIEKVARGRARIDGTGEVPGMSAEDGRGRGGRERRSDGLPLVRRRVRPRGEGAASCQAAGQDQLQRR